MKRFLPDFSRRPQRSENTLRLRQRGVSIIAAIFLLLLMAGLAAAMANIMSSTHINLASDIGGSRAYQAARAGAEWGMYQLDPNAELSNLPSCATAAGTLSNIPGHTVSVTCESFPNDTVWYTEGSKQVRIFRITSTATAPGLVGIERQVQVTLEKCRDPAFTVAPFGC